MADLTNGVSVVPTEWGAALRLDEEKGQPQYQPDFSSETMERKISDLLKRKGLLFKAIEGRAFKNQSLKIFDFYSGFAQDAFCLACCGHKVISCEKNKMISHVTQASWEKQREVEWVKILDPQLKLVGAGSEEWLRSQEEKFDVIYMDPMFEKIKTSAKSPLAMQMVQKILENEKMQDLEEHFEVAAQYTNKVVLKFPLKGVSFLKKKPSHQLFGKTIRFDVFQW